MCAQDSGKKKNKKKTKTKQNKIYPTTWNYVLDCPSAQGEEKSMTNVLTGEIFEAVNADTK